MIWAGIKQLHQLWGQNRIVDASPAKRRSPEATPKALSKIATRQPRIALLTPYMGGNLGDGAIQDAVIANLRVRLPEAQFAGITLNSENFVERHGTAAFPLAGASVQFYGMAHGRLFEPSAEFESPTRRAAEHHSHAWLDRIGARLREVPGLARFARAVRAAAAAIATEAAHWIEGYRFLRQEDLLIVSGGGQLDEEWGGAWGHPYALFKWAILARCAGVPYAIASVGACKINSQSARLFLRTALFLARYRSYRDEHSRDAAVGLLGRAARDPIVADPALNLSSDESAQPAKGAAPIKHPRLIAVSPIAYAKPGRWPSPDGVIHERYLAEMAKLVARLLQRGDRLMIICSSLGDDESVIPELLARLDQVSQNRLATQLVISPIRTWKDFAAALHDADFLIASRLHGAILGFNVGTPTVAISFDSKVDWLMADCDQSDYRLDIRDFTAQDAMDALGRLEDNRDAALQKIASHRQGVALACARQYDALAVLATARGRSFGEI